MPGWNTVKNVFRSLLDGYWRNAQIASPWIVLHPLATLAALFYGAALVLWGLVSLALFCVWAVLMVLWTILRFVIWLVAWLAMHLIWLVRLCAAKLRQAEPPERPAFPLLDFLRGGSREMTGLEYEQYVARRLRKEKYRQVQVTQGSGDFGADVLAVDPWGNSVSIQCKYYQGKVGVHAVQEIVAAQQYYGTERAMVITNSSFTPAAVKLAEQTGVELVDYYID